MVGRGDDICLLLSFEKFIKDMKKLFAVCAISNFGAKICQFGIMDDFSNGLFGGHINTLCTVSPDVSQCLSA